MLDEILKLEKTSSKTFSSVTTRCVTGVIQDQHAHLVTNLVDGKTQTLFQPQGIWVIGRDRQLAIPIPDRWLSRRHAVIQYVHNEGFYLVDLESTNCSFVNKEPIHGRILLKDGDRVRLSSLAFSFFLSSNSQILGDTPSDILAQLEASTVAPISTTIESVSLPVLPHRLHDPNAESVGYKEKTADFLQEASELEESDIEPLTTPLSPAQQSEILDRFFSRQTQKVMY